MPIWLKLAEGPVMKFVLAVLVLGLARVMVITVLGMVEAWRMAGDRRVPVLTLLRETGAWLLPIRRIHRARLGYSLASIALHLGILIAGLFLANHLDILKSNLGFAWFALPKGLLDWLTLMGLAGGVTLLLNRLYVRSSRALSGGMDYLLLALLVLIFASGFVAGQPWNPIPYDVLMLSHTLSGMAILLLAPFSKIAHCVLFPLMRLATDLAWRLRPRGGSRVVEALHGPEGRPL